MENSSRSKPRYQIKIQIFKIFLAELFKIFNLFKVNSNFSLRVVKSRILKKFSEGRQSARTKSLKEPLGAREPRFGQPDLQ